MTDFLPRLLLYAAIAAALVGMGAVGASKYYAPRLEAEKRAFAEFRGGVEALGRAASLKAKETDEANRKRKQDADKENAAAVAALRGTIAGLRGERAKRGAAGGFVSQPAPDALGLRLSCYDSAKLDDALRKLDRGIQGLVAEGDQATIDLNSVRKWISSIYTETPAR